MPRIGPLLGSIKHIDQGGPRSVLHATVTEAVKAFAEGGAAVSNLKP